ncbi:hypothetical protein KSP39_PZI014165 [Platanthera zijinensis]|uniref:Uncharacterized protein n=1 Tax=Platanthera zijinensis TaxID=2320716 RepID=A0AAP0G3A6_9ASPA
MTGWRRPQQTLTTIGVKAVAGDPNDDRRVLAGGSKSTTNLLSTSQNHTPLPPLLVGGSQSQSPQVAIFMLGQLSTPLLIFLLSSLVAGYFINGFLSAFISSCCSSIPLRWRFSLTHPFCPIIANFLSTSASTSSILFNFLFGFIFEALVCALY